MAQRKHFFEERTVNEIKDLVSRDVYTQRNLVKRIVDLDKDDAFVLRSPLVSGRFSTFPYVENQADASRAYLKHADTRHNEMLELKKPETVQAALNSLENPFHIRNQALESLADLREEEIHVIGRCFYPLIGVDRRLRRIPFYADFEGAKIRAYEEAMTKQGAVVDDRYTNARRVAIEGGKVLVDVSSRTKGRKRWPVMFLFVPLVDIQNKRVVSWGIKTDHGDVEEEREPVPTRAWQQLRYTRGTEQASSDVFTAIPQDAAGYFSIINHYFAKGNLIPIEQSQFILPSKFAVEQLWRKLGNNILVYDPTLQREDKLRKPHLAEKSLILARTLARGNFKPEEIFWWDPNRDGRIRDYAWNYD